MPCVPCMSYMQADKEGEAAPELEVGCHNREGEGHSQYLAYQIQLATTCLSGFYPK